MAASTLGIIPSILFLLFAQKLYQVDIETGTSQVLEEGIKQNHFVVSDTKAHGSMAD